MIQTVNVSPDEADDMSAAVGISSAAAVKPRPSAVRRDLIVLCSPSVADVADRARGFVKIINEPPEDSGRPNTLRSSCAAPVPGTAVGSAA
jgi:hypothetical protein